MSRASRLSGFTTAISGDTDLNVGIVTAQQLITDQTLTFTNLNVTGIATIPVISGVTTIGSDVVVGGATTALVVNGDARVTGILTVGTSSLTLNGDSSTISGITTVNSVSLPSTGALSNRNIIINGAMNVWQRGTSQTTSGNYAADRFWMTNATSAARDTSAPAGFVYSTKLTYNSSDMSIGQPIELTATGIQDGVLASGNTVTLSYYAKVDSGTEAIGTGINFRESKFSSSNQVAFTSSNSNATWTTTWTRYEHQFTVPTVAGTNVIAAFEINGISRTAYITGVQLEVGTQASSFEHRSYSDELQRCRRYFQHFTCGGAGTATGGGQTQSAMCTVNYSPEMRATPTVTFGVPTSSLNTSGTVLAFVSRKTGCCPGAPSSAAGRQFWGIGISTASAEY